VQLVQLNDVYRIFPTAVPVDGGVVRKGGMAYVATAVKEYRKTGDVLLLHAGDMFSPSLLSSRLRHKGAQMIAALNAVGVDMATFGNHEFDFGCKHFAKRVRESTFPWVAANVEIPVEAGLPEGKIEPYRIVERAGLRIGIFGLALPIQPISGCGDGEIRFQDPYEAAGTSIEHLKREGVDLIIGLTHLRMEQDKELARRYPDIDVIVGGHEHEVLEALIGKTLITKAGADAYGLGVVDLTAVRAAGELVVEKRLRWDPVDADRIPPDPAVQRRLSGYAAELRPYEEVIGRVITSLDARESTIREGESNLGNWVADTLRATTGSDAALVNGGGFRDDRVISEGPFTLGDLYTLLPFENEIVEIEVTGRELLSALENGVSLAGEKAGRFPHVSGITFVFDPTGPVGSRVSDVKIGGVPLDPKARYSLATTDFLVKKGEIDGYTMLRKEIRKSGGSLNEAIRRRIEENGKICAVLDGRIRLRGEAGGSAGRCR